MIVTLGTTPTVARSMTFPQVTPDSANRASAVHEYAAGKSINASRVLYSLGVDVITTGFVGGDRGKFIQADLSRAGIKHRFLQVAANTRLCTTVIDQSAGTATELIEEAQPLPIEKYYELVERLDPLLDQSKILILSGSLPPGAPRDFYEKCVSLTGQTVRVVLDAVGAPLLEALPRRPFLIKPNQAEVGQTLGVPVDTESELRDGMRKLIGLGAKWVVVTRGKDGALITDGKSFWTVNTPGVKVISAIGSGDSFAAGLALGLANGDEVPQACRLATACGAANTITPYSGHIDPATVRSLLDLVNLSESHS